MKKIKNLLRPNLRIGANLGLTRGTASASFNPLLTKKRLKIKKRLY